MTISTKYAEMNQANQIQAESVFQYIDEYGQLDDTVKTADQLIDICRLFATIDREAVCYLVDLLEQSEPNDINDKLVESFSTALMYS